MEQGAGGGQRIPLRCMHGASMFFIIAGAVSVSKNTTVKHVLSQGLDPHRSKSCWPLSPLRDDMGSRPDVQFVCTSSRCGGGTLDHSEHQSSQKGHQQLGLGN
jgi:hypothetical protein